MSKNQQKSSEDGGRDGREGGDREGEREREAGKGRRGPSEAGYSASMKYNLDWHYIGHVTNVLEIFPPPQ